MKVWIMFVVKKFNLAHGLGQIFLAVNQLFNVIAGNPFSKETWAKETVSSRCGRLGHRQPYKFWKWFIDTILFGWWQGPNHCIKAFQKEKTRYHFPPSMRNVEPTNENNTNT